MKVQVLENKVDAAGTTGKHKVTIESNAVAFYANISGLVKDKVRYPIRELCGNAWDVAGGDFDFWLPTPLNPVFRLRDYGTGISHDAMVTRLCKLYASDKRDDPTKIGGWGIGRFSPFAYLIGDKGVGSYTFISYYNGEKRTYVFSLGADGTPEMHELPAVKTDERNGVEIMFPVRKEDVDAFNHAAADVLWSFHPTPRIHPAPTWPDPRVLSQGQNWKLYARGSVPFTGPHVRMGCVMYPIKLDQVPDIGFLEATDPILFDAPIGSIKMTLSREDLAYDPTTVNTIQRLVGEFKDELVANIQAKLNEQETFILASHKLWELTREYSTNRRNVVRDAVRWHNYALYDQITCKDKHFKLMRVTARMRPDKFETVNAVHPYELSNHKIVVEHSPQYSIRKLEKAGLFGSDFLWIRCKKGDLEEVLTQIGNPDYMVLDDVEVEENKRPKNIKKRRVLRVHHINGTCNMETVDIDMAAGGKFIKLGFRNNNWSSRRWRSGYMVETNRTVDDTAFKRFIEACVKLNLLSLDDRILIATEDEKLPDVWQWLGEAMMPQLRAKITVDQLKPTFDKTVNNLSHHLRHFSRYNIEQAPDDLKLLAEEAKNLINQLNGNTQRKDSDADVAFTALKFIGYNEIPERVVVKCPCDDLNNRWNALKRDRYPILETLLSASTWGWEHADREKQRYLTHYFHLLKAEAQVKALKEGGQQKEVA